VNTTAKYFRLLFLVVIIMFSYTTRSQTLQSFTREPETFINELTGFIEEIRIRENRQLAQETMNIFSGYWFAGTFTHDQQQLIYQTADLMLQRRLRSFPDFKQYFNAVNKFVKHEIALADFDIWLQSLHDELENNRNSRDFSALLDFTAVFLEEGVLSASRIFTWSVGKHDFKFLNDSVFCIALHSIDLVCTTRNDTSVIYQTNGVYYPDRHLWKGSGGRINWQRAGLPENAVYAVLSEYEIELKSAGFEIYPVAFYHTTYFRGALTGRLTERTSTNAVTPMNLRYPRFDSDIGDLYIPGIFSDIDYSGGFSLRGAKIFGSGNASAPASMTFKRPYRDRSGSFDLMIVRSNDFIIEADAVNAETAAIAVYHQDDSITHAGLQFRYSHPNREISLLRIKQGIEQSPFFNTFHGVEIDVEAIYWRMDEEDMQFGALRGLQKQNTATFLSDRFYSAQLFDRLLGLDRKHPLLWLYDYSNEFNTNQFSVDQMATYMRMPESQVELQMIRLATLGFLHYNVDQRNAFINDKVDHFIHAKSGQSDFDVINFVSQVTDRTNAVLKLENFDLKIRGVPDVNISNAKNVSIIPDNREVTLRKNRDFLFSGIIKAGLFEFEATDCYFNYDTFKLNMPTVNNMRFKVRSFETDRDNKSRFVDVKTTLADISGDMLIDRPNNKSGRQPTPRYPIFNSVAESYIYFDYLPGHKEAYNREFFNYYIEPFTLESLEEFATEDIRFEGHLNSGGILPDPIEEPLVVMPDYSLGFKRKAPTQGYTLYKGKGNFFEDVILSHSGLRGIGQLDYLNSTSKSSDFIFYLDSAKATRVEFDVSEKITGQLAFPSAKGSNLKQRWLPYDDVMEVATTDSPITLFDDKATLEGALTLTPDQMTGAGKLDFLNATAYSNRYVFGANAFQSDTIRLLLRDAAVSDIVFNTENYKAKVDLEKKTGNFKTNDITSKIDLPVIRYVSYLNEFDWYFERNEIELYSYAKVDISGYDTMSKADLISKPMPGARFISTHPLHDSLSFYSPRANYNVAGNILTAQDVQLIKVADAAIFPGDGLIEIHENAVIQPIQGAVIIADTSNKNHIITDALVNIESGYSYKASGSYAFNNAIGEVQTIHFDAVKVDTSYQTVATAKVAEEDIFQFSPRFAFKGEVTLNAGDPLLQFAGGYRVLQDCDSALMRWVAFSQRINPDALVLPVSSPIREYNYKQLYAGFFHSNENNRVYSTFLSRRGYYSDSLLFSVNGALKSRSRGAELLIVDSSQIFISDNEAPAAPFLKWDVDQCIITGRGKMTFGHDLGEVKLDVFGQADHFIIPDSTHFNVFMTLDFLFVDEALALMAEDLQQTNKPALDMTASLIKESFDHFLGRNEAERVFTDLSLYGAIRRVPDALAKNFVFSDINMTYHSNSRSFISDGPIGVVMILGKPVYKYFDGYIQLIRRRTGDVLHVYLELDRNHWYYFTHRGNLLQTASSRTDYNKAVEDIKPSKRRERGSGETAYRYMLTDSQARNRFLREMRQFENE
jgi:hypothetical protein